MPPHLFHKALDDISRCYSLAAGRRVFRTYTGARVRGQPYASSFAQLLSRQFSSELESSNPSCPNLRKTDLTSGTLIREWLFPLHMRRSWQLATSRSITELTRCGEYGMAAAPQHTASTASPCSAICPESSASVCLPHPGRVPAGASAPAHIVFARPARCVGKR